MTVLRPLLILGTRPEAIKMAPVVLECARRGGRIKPIICFTGQHDEMLRQVTDYFSIQADVDLKVMSAGQSLAQLTARCLTSLDDLVAREKPDCLVAQGDTTSVLAASMVAFYRQLPFMHVEAGLRTGNLQQPWPEEFNRRVASITTTLHAAPTERAKENLLKEGIPTQQIRVTGNTVIDALLDVAARAYDWHAGPLAAVPRDRRLILVTAHRRESFGAPFEQICGALKELATSFPDVHIVYPVHLNPNVRRPVYGTLGNLANVSLLEPLEYLPLVQLLKQAYLVLTDSGGLQEEAPGLGKPVLVMRETTERPEGVAAGTVKLVGTDQATIVRETTRLLNDEVEYERMACAVNPYGDGHASVRIIESLREHSRPK